MKWPEIRNLFPNRFVLIEATKAASDKQRRTIEEMYVVDRYNSSAEAWSSYKEHHKEHPEREFYIFHTSKENVEVVEEFFNGIRV